MDVNINNVAKQSDLVSEIAARIAAIDALKGGVVTAGDTLKKLYDLIQGISTEQTVANIAARNAYNIPSLPYNIFVLDDGDGKWALYKALTTGVNATYIKLSDPDLLNAAMSASQIEAAYEGIANTNKYTNADKALVATVANKVDKIAGKGLSTNDYTIAEKNAVNATWVDYSSLYTLTGINTLTINKYNYILDEIARTCEVEIQIQGKLILTNTSPTITLPFPIATNANAIYLLTAIINNAQTVLGWGVCQSNTNLMTFFNGVGFGFFTTTASSCGVFVRVKYRY